MFVFVLFWFQLYNGFSGSNAIDDISLIFFNLLFTSVPPVICAILDKDVPDPILTANPDLYKTGQNSKVGQSVLQNDIRVVKGAVSRNLSKFKQSKVPPFWAKHKNNLSKHLNKV